MAGMKRFVTYIYAYEDKKKGSNIGFARIDIRGEDCRLEIHLRGAYVKQATCNVYLFRENSGKMQGFKIGEMQLVNGNGDYVAILKVGRIADSTFPMGDMDGIVLLSEDKSMFMSRWKEGNVIEVCLENFYMWQPQQEENNRQEENIWQEESNRQEESTLQEEPIQVDTEYEQDVQATEIPMPNIFPEYNWQSIWENLIQNHTIYHPFDNPKAECIQIELKHLRELPKCYWYLGNNSFLLHGFFNYHYLVIGKTSEERWFLGVPGIYQRQERVMAAIFGFPGFLAMAQKEKAEAEGEEPVNRFGCWCRYIEE